MDGEVDLVLASYSITDERREVVGQAGPYYVTGQQLLVTADSDIESLEDLKGKEVCSVTGSTSLENIEDEGAKPRGFDTYSECVDQVLNGTVDAMTTDGAILLGLRRGEPRRAQGRRGAVLRGAVRRRLHPGRPRDVRVDQRHARAAYEDGTWDEAFEATLGESGVETPEPPAIDECPA